MPSYGYLSLRQAEGHAFDRDEYQRDVHAMDYNVMIRPHPALKTLLLQIDPPVYIFTNGDREHAEKCLQCMDMENIFQVMLEHSAGHLRERIGQGIICYNSLQENARDAGMDMSSRVVCKPHPEVMPSGA